MRVMTSLITCQSIKLDIKGVINAKLNSLSSSNNKVYRNRGAPTIRNKGSSLAEEPYRKMIISHKTVI